jgi:Domain of unknown function (DUF5666)
MRPIVLAVPVATIALLAWFALDATAQTSKTTRGTVTAMSGDMVTVKTANLEMKFTVDAKTTVTVDGGTTASRKADASGQSGPKLSELIQVGNPVEVTYVESGGVMRATGIRRVVDASGPAPTGQTAPRSETVNGTVDSISGNTVTVSGTTGDAKFKQSITVDNTTKIVAEGAGTAASKSGGKLVLSEHIGPGDRVTITYHPQGTTLHATEIRVRQRAKK